MTEPPAIDREAADQPATDQPTSGRTLQGRAFLKHCYDLKSADEVQAFYEQRAGEYDAVLRDTIGYVAPERTAGIFAEFMEDRSARIIDIGCGTGFVGEALRGHGYSCIDGADFAKPMLDEARTKGVYQELLQLDLNDPAALGGRRYDAAISVGSFGEAHIGAEALDNVPPIVARGGIFCVCLNERCIGEMGFDAKLREMRDRGAVEILSFTEQPYHTKSGIKGWVCVMRVV